MIKAVIFDLDGTLTNTLTDISTAMNRALRLHGLPEYPEQAYRYMVGNGAKMLAIRAVGAHQELMQDVLADYQAYYETHTQVTTRPYDGIPELLAALQARGLALCVLSNKPHADTNNVVRHYFPDVGWAQIRGQIEGVPVKPDPAGAIAIMHQLQVRPDECFYLGDTNVDMQTAKHAGFHAIGVLWGFRDEKELRDNGAEHIIASPLDLLKLL